MKALDRPRILALLVPLLAALGRAEAGGFTPNISTSKTGVDYVLVGTSDTQSITVKNTSTSSTETVTLPGTKTAPFSSSGASGTLAAATKTTPSLTSSYTYTPTSRSGSVVKEAVAVTATQNSKPTSTVTQTVNLQWQAVAPVESVSHTDAGLTRIGTTGTAGSVTIKNTGDGNLAGAANADYLNGKVNGLSPSSPFGIAGGSFSLYGNGSTFGSKSYPYLYTPTGHNSDSTSLSITFSNGNKNGTNASEQVTVQLNGQGVGPVYDSSVSPDSIIDFGKVFSGKTATDHLEVKNNSTDPNGGNVSLTNLTLLSYTITGDPGFSLSGFKAGAVLGENQWRDLGISFRATGPAGQRDATLTLITDQGAALGTPGAAFSYDLTATVVPEPGSLALLTSAALAVLGSGLLRTGTARRGQPAQS